MPIDSPFDKQIDASGLACPMPIVKTKKALAGLSSGQVLRILSTDPGSVPDMAALAEQGGHTLLESGRAGDAFVFLLRKA